LSSLRLYHKQYPLGRLLQPGGGLARANAARKVRGLRRGELSGQPN
jgi:hypothetical protein